MKFRINSPYRFFRYSWDKVRVIVFLNNCGRSYMKGKMGPGFLWKLTETLKEELIGLNQSEALKILPSLMEDIKKEHFIE